MQIIAETFSLTQSPVRVMQWACPMGSVPARLGGTLLVT
jgi:hypothetical protein